LEQWQVPPDPQEPLTAGWAASGDTFCRISGTLRCRTGRAAWQRPRTALYVAPKDTDFSHFQEPRVTFAADPDVATYQHDDAGVVLLQVLLGADGSVRQALVRSTPRAEYVPTALAAVRRWKFKPAVRDGKPVAAEALITIGFFQSTP
jgi:protein TonB